MELIVFFCTIVGTVIAIVTYQKTFHKKPSEEVGNLAAQYDFAKSLTYKVLLKLENYARDNNAHSTHMMQGITFQKGINILKEAQAKIFNSETDAIIEEVKHKHIYGIAGQNLLKRIEAHIQHTSEVQTHFNFYFEPEDKGIID